MEASEEWQPPYVSEDVAAERYGATRWRFER
jgi:hypothetical protein